MARLLSFLRRRAAEHDEDARPRPADGTPRDAGDAPPIDRARVPRAGNLRRERRVLLREREERIRDLGGIALEMYRRDGFRNELLVDRCAELVELDRRLSDISDLLAVLAGRPPVHLGRCECGALLLFGAHFCANCGRPAGAPVVACTNCGHALPADANFCALCGHATPSEPWERPALRASTAGDRDSGANGTAREPREDAP